MAERLAVILVDPSTGLPYAALPVTNGSTENRTASGNIMSTQSVAVNTASCGSVGLQVSGTWAGTISFEYTFDGSTWFALSAEPTGGGPPASSTAANGGWTTEVASYSQVRARGNTVGSGSAAVFLAASTAATTVVIGMPMPSGDNTIGRVKLTDGANVAGIDASGRLSVQDSPGIAALATEATLSAAKTLLGGGLPAALAGSRLDVSVGASVLPTSAAKDSTLTDGTQRVGGTVAITAASLPLPANAALETGGNLAGIFGQLDGKTSTLAAKTQLPSALGQTTKTASLSVAIASDQTVPVSFTPTGTTDVNLTKVGGSAVALGQATMVASLPIAIASNQSSLPVTVSNSFALDTSVNGILVAQASSTSGQSGPIVQGAVTTAAPSYATAKTSPISLTTAGAVRTDASATTQPVSGTVAVSNSFALDATLAKLTVAQSASLGTNTQALVGGSVTIAAPTYATGQVSPLSVTTAGALRTDSSATTQPVSGTVTANIGTSGSLALDASVTALQVSQGSTTSGQKGGLGLGAVTTAAPSYTTAQSSPLSITTGGLLRVTDPGNPTLGTAGSAASTVLSVQGIASMTPVQVSQATASNLLAQVFGGAASGALVSGNPVRIAGSDGTSTRDIKTDTSGNLIMGGGGTAGSPAGGILTVQGSSSMTALTVGGAATAGSAASGNPVLFGGTDGTNARIVETDTSGRLAPRGGSTYYQTNTQNLSANIKSGAGILRGFFVTAPGAANCICTLYDSLTGSGTILALFVTSTQLSMPNMDLKFTTGLSIVTNNIAPANITLGYANAANE